MRILHAIHSANVKGGGPIEGIKQLSANNVAAGHTVELVSLDDPAEPWIKDFPLKIHAMGPSYLSYGYTPRFVPWLEKNHHLYDVVIINGIWQYNSFGVWRALRNSATPYCVFTHGMLDPWFKHSYPLKHLKKWLYWPWGEYRVLRDALAVFFTTEEERRLARRSFWLYRCDEIVVSYGIAGAVGDPDAQRAGFFSKFPETQGKELILFLGRLHEKKGCDLLLRSFAAALKSDAVDPARKEQLRLVMGGGGSDDYVAGLKALAAELGIADRITWTGMITGDLKWGAFRAADAFFLVSHQENFGIAVAEALSAGLPVLISNRVNIWREVKLHNAGLIEADDLTGASRILQRWLALDAAARTKMRANAAHCFDRCFNVAYFAESFIKSLHLLGLPD
jgi:glycosyltransferase involved in cell wall biosynthesis